jgi:4'-phosphopantetheinyl transferase
MPDTLAEPRLEFPATVEAHWLALDVEAVRIAELMDLLSQQELQRAVAFRFARDRDRYIVRRAWLRRLIAARLGCRPQEVELCHGAHGKPFVRGSALRFNLSHSGDLALCVLASGIELGCDIEWRRPELTSPAVARSCFSPQEMEKLQTQSGSDWLRSFFNGWTRKEALLKGLGLGLSASLADYDVSLLPDEPAAVLRGANGWSLCAFEPFFGLHAAIAVETGGLASHGSTGQQQTLRRAKGNAKDDVHLRPKVAETELINDQWLQPRSFPAVSPSRKPGLQSRAIKGSARENAIHDDQTINIELDMEFEIAVQRPYEVSRFRRTAYVPYLHLRAERVRPRHRS